MAANKGLFGAFGGRSTLDRLRDPDALDAVVSGPTLTVGVSDPWVGTPGRSFAAETADGCCALWGEAYLPTDAGADPGRWLLSQYAERGREALAELNGSYVVALEHASRGPLVATDAVRSRECYYAIVDGERAFGTDPAALSRTLVDPDVRAEPLLEFLQFGAVLGDRTVLAGLDRLPFDGGLTPAGPVHLDRFVYEPQSFDYVGELAARLRRALERRDGLPGRAGALLSGGYDSRLLLSGISGIDVAYTLGRAESSEVGVARRVAGQYGVGHRTLELDDRYIGTDWSTVQYGHGLMESLHVHHGGYTDRMDVDVVYHGALGDTLLRGHFLPLDGVDLFEHTCPPYRLDPDPDVAEHFAGKFGYRPECDRFLETDAVPEDDGVAFLRRRVSEVLEGHDERFASTYDGMALFGVQNQPTRSFRFHLIDHFLESCVAVDSELVDWHLSTPPTHRNTRTFLRAIRRLDGDLLRHRPPDRPYDSYTLNQVRNFVRRTLPGVDAYEGPWPDRGRLYDRTGLDRTAFADEPSVRRLPWRVKLRVNDLATWLDRANTGPAARPTDLLSTAAAPRPPGGTSD
ncbi:MAG: hypothetical protein ABEJ40_01730 [Haloarculaceae archaeon]